MFVLQYAETENRTHTLCNPIYLPYSKLPLCEAYQILFLLRLCQRAVDSYGFQQRLSEVVWSF